MTVRDEQLAPRPRTPEDTKQQLAAYYACITGLDHHVRRIFAALNASGQWDDTILVFSGYNRLSMGEPGLFGKQKKRKSAACSTLRIATASAPSAMLDGNLQLTQGKRLKQ